MSIAGLYMLVATCEARGITPKRRLDELLPGPWSRAQTTAHWNVADAVGAT